MWNAECGKMVLQAELLALLGTILDTGYWMLDSDFLISSIQYQG